MPQFQQRQQDQQAQPKGKNRFNPQQKKLVSLIAELEMLKKLGNDTARATEDMRNLLDARADEAVSATELALVDRLAHRHNEITKLFQQIKAGVEATLEAMQGNGEGEGEPQGGSGREGK